MNILNSTSQKYYFCVMITESIILSVIYWLFFDITFSSIIVYITSITFYITGYILWKNIRQRNEHLLFNPSERYLIINLITLFFILLIGSFLSKDLIIMTPIYLLFIIIFVSYYIFRLKKQKESTVKMPTISSYSKNLTVMSILFLLFDLIVYICGRLQIQLVLYIPILFAVFTFLLSIYKKELAFKSFVAFLLFFNVYIISSLLLVLNYLYNNLFAFLVILHLILFFATVCLFKINSVETDDKDFYYNHNLFGLLFSNIIIIFISLNNILSFSIPNTFASYLYFSVLVIITYLIYCIYKILAKI